MIKVEASKKDGYAQVSIDGVKALDCADEIGNGEFIFDQNKANKVIRFFEKFVRHNKGALAPEVITLSIWQKALLSLIFGIVDENGLRVFHEVFIVNCASTYKGILKPVPQKIQTEFAEILKLSIVGGYREGMKEAQHETVD